MFRSNLFVVVLVAANSGVSAGFLGSAAIRSRCCSGQKLSVVVVVVAADAGGSAGYGGSVANL